MDFPSGRRGRRPEHQWGHPGPGQQDGREGRRHHHHHHDMHGDFGPRERFRDGPRGRGHFAGRARRGDVRTAILLLLDESPMHGYQLIAEITDRTRGAWQPSPGAVYPALRGLEDDGLVTTSESAGRRVVELTGEGHEYVTANRDRLERAWAQASTELGAGGGLRESLGALMMAARQVGRIGGPAEVEQARKILANARRRLYLLLAEAGGALDTEPEAEDSAPDLD